MVGTVERGDGRWHVRAVWAWALCDCVIASLLQTRGRSDVRAIFPEFVDADRSPFNLGGSIVDVWLLAVVRAALAAVWLVKVRVCCAHVHFDDDKDDDDDDDDDDDASWMSQVGSVSDDCEKIASE
jgi:hypothetical protein